MSATFSIPGPGGSLGKCALCGENFLLEIILGTKYRMVEVDGFDRPMPMHQKCIDVMEKNGKDWRTLPEGPLKEAFAAAHTQSHTQ